MNKHVLLRINQAKLISEMSPCPRGKVGAVIFDEASNTVVSDGYNGPPRGGNKHCGFSDSCRRNSEQIKSGTNTQIGCHHAEANALCNAARQGASTLGKSLAVTCAPCLMCAKLIHHAGIDQVYYKENSYLCEEGIEYLSRVGVKVSPYQ